MNADDDDAGENPSDLIGCRENNIDPEKDLHFESIVERDLHSNSPIQCSLRSHVKRESHQTKLVCIFNNADLIQWQRAQLKQTGFRDKLDLLSLRCVDSVPDGCVASHESLDGDRESFPPPVC